MVPMTRRVNSRFLVSPREIARNSCWERRCWTSSSSGRVRFKSTAITGTRVPFSGSTRRWKCGGPRTVFSGRRSSLARLKSSGVKWLGNRGVSVRGSFAGDYFYC